MEVLVWEELYSMERGVAIARYLGYETVFEKNYIVWKAPCSGKDDDICSFVWEELYSMESKAYIKNIEQIDKFEKNYIVWKDWFFCYCFNIDYVWEELYSMESISLFFCFLKWTKFEKNYIVWKEWKGKNNISISKESIVWEELYSMERYMPHIWQEINWKFEKNYIVWKVDLRNISKNT